ncbi:hypothetical protein CKA32_003225 [Geitlerinema sp. FC II]|nr:hypothetical protein CKA32_003225 [Geitlerinema sp. FC II]
MFPRLKRTTSSRRFTTPQALGYGRSTATDLGRVEKPFKDLLQCRATAEPRGDRSSILSSLSLSQSRTFQQLRGRSLYRQKAIEIAGNRNISPYNTTNGKYFCHHRLQLGQYR